jgi:hypothetical protein
MTLAPPVAGGQPVLDATNANYGLKVNSDGSINIGSGGGSPPASTVAPITSVNAATSNTAILAVNSARKGTLIYNNSTSAMYLAYGATASTSAFSVKIPANALFELPTAPTWTGALSAVWDSATGAALVTEES